MGIVGPITNSRPVAKPKAGHRGRRAGPWQGSSTRRPVQRASHGNLLHAHAGFKGNHTCSAGFGASMVGAAGTATGAGAGAGAATGFGAGAGVGAGAGTGGSGFGAGWVLK